ncbi:MAG: hypothetical protein P4L22_06575 [Candidatus Babeliales bacterium]|nr:hypothetical protein [Candidatus Babeliales bacterium]
MDQNIAGLKRKIEAVNTRADSLEFELASGFAKVQQSISKKK